MGNYANGSVGNSYGRSPDLNFSEDAWFVYDIGSVVTGHNTYIDSYGIQ